MSLASRISDLAGAVRDKINLMMPRLLPAGGSSGQVLAKTSATDYATSWQTVSGGGPISVLDLPVQSSDVAPAAGNGRIYSSEISGRIMPKWIDPLGLDYPLQPHAGFNYVGIWRGGFSAAAGTTIAVTGPMPASVTSANVTNPAPTSTSLLSSVARSGLATSTTAGNVTHARALVSHAHRGNVAEAGGFHFGMRFALSTQNAAQRFFAGLTSNGAAPTNIDDFADTTSGKIGLAVNTNTGNWRLIHNTQGTVPASIDLGATMPVNNTDLMELLLFSPKSGTSVFYRVRNMTTGAVVTGTLSTNLPAATQFLLPLIKMTNNTAAATVSFLFVSAFLEMDN